MQRRKNYFRGRKTVLIIVSVVGLFILFCRKLNTRNSGQEYLHVNGFLYSQATIDTEGCKVPAMKLYDDVVNQAMRQDLSIKCPQNKPLIERNTSHIWIVKENIVHYSNFTNEKRDFFCFYRPFYRPYRIKNITAYDVDHRVVYGPPFNISTSVKVKAKHEFIHVKCYADNRIVYRNFYLFAKTKNFISRDRSFQLKQNGSFYNVIVIGFDSISRLHLYRAMPAALEYFKSLGSVEIFGYNKIGDNTLPNAISLLMGIKENELKKTCLQYTRATYDGCPFIWQRYKQAGYFTAFSEDTSTGTFNLLQTGFSGYPTDYYTHTFMHQLGKYMNTSLQCVHGKYLHQIVLDYLAELSSVLHSEEKLLFGYFWESSISHDKLEDAKLLDADYLELFKLLHKRNYLNQSIVFLVSDHGLRFGKIARTSRGRLETRLPFLHILVPQSFRDKYKAAYKNLMLNSRRFTTPLDLHETLADLVDLNYITDEIILKRSKESYSKNRAISMFLSIPGNRTCKNADIDDHWCTCHLSKQLPVTSELAQKASEFVISSLNLNLLLIRRCAELSVRKVIDFAEVVTKFDSGEKLFTVMLEATPGGGVFEATLWMNDGKWNIAGSVSRLNLYGDQSSCVDDYHLKLYCYCID